MVMNMNISYDYYRAFYYVAKHRSFTAAAAAMMSSQPNVTRAIKNLESALGCTLFVRGHRSISLTDEGEALYRHVRIAFEHIRTGEEELALEKSLQGGLISVSVSEVALHCLMLPVLGRFRRTYPGVRIRISNHTTRQAVSALKNGLVDLAVVTTPTEEGSSLLRTDIKTVREVPVCGNALKELAHKTLSLKELAEFPIISLNPQSMTYAMYSKFFSLHGLEFSPDIEVATADLILPMVRHNLGIGFVPEEFLKSDESDVFLLDVKQAAPSREICLLKRKNHSLSTAARKLEQLILQYKTAEIP